LRSANGHGGWRGTAAAGVVTVWDTYGGGDSENVERLGGVYVYVYGW
jgi:hypothetical protein